VHETRNFIMVILLVAGVVWSVVAWFIFSDGAAILLLQRTASLMLVVSMGAWLFYALKIEDKLPDHLGSTVGELYYDVDGLSFMPTVRHHNGQAELCVYYQNRFENPVQAIVHLRPVGDSFIIRPNAVDVHIAFTAGAGDYGAIHQPIAVPEHLQGEVLELELAAASYYARSHGARLRRRPGMPCGSMLVDWSGSAFKVGVHEVSGEIELHNPSRLRLSMPKGVNAFCTGNESWRQECLAQGTPT
jgi:hypothetical protein